MRIAALTLLLLRLAAQDRLATSPAARLEVRLADATTLTLGENSEALATVSFGN
jgi:hypothetical protein